MRITNKMLSNNFLRDMRTNLNNLSTIQNQMASGKQIRKPSDDPAKASKIMQMYSDIDANTQYNSNIKNTSNWLDTTDKVLGQIGDVTTRIQELLVSVNGTFGPNERAAVKDEINQKVGELSQMLNTSFDGKYIFGGTRGTTKPTETSKVGDNTQLGFAKIGGGELDLTNAADSIEYNQINSSLLVEVSQGVTMEYNVTATEVVNYGTGDNNLSKLLENITSHLSSTATADDISALSGDDLKGIQDFSTNVLKLRSQVGSKQNTMESAQTRNDENNLNMTEILSATEDIDITEKAMEYATMQTIYLASLQTSAKVIQPSLLDYL